MTDTKIAEQDTKAVTTAGPNIVMPAVSPDEAVAAWDAYQALKHRIATPDDVQQIQGREFYKKSYWRKIATFFNLSVEITEERKEELENNVVYHFTQKAIAPNGRFAYGVGSCDLLEKGRRNTIHNTRGTAETRAFNRAISNLIGGGEVSAEEMDAERARPDHAEGTQQHQTPYNPRQMAEHLESRDNSKTQQTSVPDIVKSHANGGFQTTDKLISDPQKYRIREELARIGKNILWLDAKLYKQMGVASMQELTMSQAIDVIKGLKAMPDKGSGSSTPPAAPLHTEAITFPDDPEQEELMESADKALSEKNL